MKFSLWIFGISVLTIFQCANAQPILTYDFQGETGNQASNDPDFEATHMAWL